MTDGEQSEAAVLQDDDGLLGFFDADGKWATVAELEDEFAEHLDSDVRKSLERLADAGILNTRRDDDGEIVTVQLSEFAVDLFEAEDDVEAALVYAYHGREPPEDKRNRYSELVQERDLDG